jgi:large subunit ribosomal protein L9
MVVDVILKKEYPTLGNALSVVTVKKGYAQNFLIPHGIAMRATASNLKQLDQLKKIEEKHQIKREEAAKEKAKHIENTPCTISVKVDENEKLFGSVSAAQIAQFLRDEGVDVEAKNVQLDEPIRELGVYTIGITLTKNVTAQLRAWIVKEE